MLNDALSSVCPESNRAIVQNSHDKLVPANLCISPFFLEKNCIKQNTDFLVPWSISGPHSVDFTPNVSPSNIHTGDFAFRNARSFL